MHILVNENIIASETLGEVIPFIKICYGILYCILPTITARTDSSLCIVHIFCTISHDTPSEVSYSCTTALYCSQP